MEQEKKGEVSQNKEKKTGMFDYKNIHTGDDKTHPGVLKAQQEKAKQDEILAKKKAEKAKLLASLKKKKK